MHRTDIDDAVGSGRTSQSGPRVDRREAARIERIERRRAQVVGAAARIMYRTGYHGMSMQAVADEAEMSVGLIYQYFGNKQEVLQVVILDILEEFRVEVPRVMDAAGSDPEARLRAGFDSYCRTIDGKREGTLLAYRESQTLTSEGRREVSRLEGETLAPFRDAVAEGIQLGHFRSVSPDLVAHNLKMVAHGWALKQWDLRPKVTLDEFIQAETELLISSLRVRD